MRRVLPLTTACLLTLTAAEPLFAQQRLFAAVYGEIVELDSRLPSLGAVVRRFPLPEDAGVPLDIAPFAGGTYLVWCNSPHVILFNTQTGVTERFSIPNFRPEKVIGTDGNARLAVLGVQLPAQRIVMIADARTGAVHLRDLGLSPIVGPVTYSIDHDALFIARLRQPLSGFGPVGYFDVDVIQGSTGTVIERIDISPANATTLALDATGTRLFVTNADGGIFAFDVATRLLVASNLTSGRQWGAAMIDERRGRVLGQFRDVEAFAIDSLQSLGTAPLPTLTVPEAPSGYLTRVTNVLDVSGQSATIFVWQTVTHSSRYVTNCVGTQLIALDADTGRVRGTTDTTAAIGQVGCGGMLARLTEPAAPLGFSAQASGHQVTFAWQPPLNATRYEIEAGSAPGLTNLATLTVTDVHLALDGVPPGIYYLRVRAINTIGKSAPSQEIRLVVQ